MENIETTERNVVEVNGVTVNLDVIVKDAEIEMNNNNNNNNNEVIKPTEKIIESQMDMIASENESQNAEIQAIDETPKNTESDTGSTNTDNGDESSAQNEPTTEGDLKVDHASESEMSDEKTESSEPSEPSEPSSYTTGSESTKDDTQTETEQSGTSENASESSTENIVQSSDSKEVATNEKSGDTEQQEKQKEEEEVTVTVIETAETTTTIDVETQSKSEETTDDTNETVKDNSSKRSPRKKATNKKRKNRTRSQKKQTDYSDLVTYTVSVSQRQRRYSLFVARGRVIDAPSDDCEIFCSNIPINVLEGELIPLFERYGKIWELRLMMSMRNPKRNAGFAFVRYTSNEAATEATEKLNNYEILPGKHLAIRLSQPNLSLFVGNIHRGLTREQIHEKISNRTTGLVKTFVKSSLYEDTKNCGFCFLEYDCHSAALKAKRALNQGNVWGRQLFVDWAQRRKQPEESDLSESKTLFINNLPKETTDQLINETLNTYGTIEKVTKIKDYAFVLFEEHQSAVNAMNEVDKAKLGNDKVEISLAMPQSMKSRPRFSTYPSYRHNKQYRRNGNRNTHFKRFNTPFGSSNQFNMRKQHKPKKVNDNDAAGAANVEQTTLSAPIPTIITTNVDDATAASMPAETLAN